MKTRGRPCSQGGVARLTHARPQAGDSSVADPPVLSVRWMALMFKHHPCITVAHPEPVDPYHKACSIWDERIARPFVTSGRRNWRLMAIRMLVAVPWGLASSLTFGIRTPRVTIRLGSW